MQAGTIVAIFFISGGALAGIVLLTIAMDRTANYRRRRAGNVHKARQLRLQNVTGEDRSMRALPSRHSRLGLPAPPRLPLPVQPQQQQKEKKQQSHKHWTGSETERQNSFDRNFDDGFRITEVFDDWDVIENGSSNNWAGPRKEDGNVC